MIYDLQRAGMGKRISAFLFDIIIAACIASGLLFAMSCIFDYDGRHEEWENLIDRYEQKYNMELNITSEEYEKLSDENKELYKKANDEFSKDPEAVKLWNTFVSMSVMSISLSIFLSIFIWEFILPLILKNGQTVGKKIFGVAVIRKDGVKMSAVQLFARAVLGKYTIEIMIPVILAVMIFFFNTGSLVTLVVLVLLLLAQLIVPLVTHNHYEIHDLLASTVAVDLSSQMIFDSTDELIAYKKKIAAQDAAEKPY